ncbi:NUDIX domain-containing protein [Phenylobacterium terrae]|uniref:NUDIX domain-containing protein n=1 Tax=Phenylobacterium terrae TaxID=2665495 RepID=A0ABW4N138_9CAUL
MAPATATTYDGLPIAKEPPFGASVVVYRRSGGGLEVLLLHRAHGGPEFEGDWAWTPPAGARQPGEDPDLAAARELREETGLELPIRRVCDGAGDWCVYAAEAPAEAMVVLDAEHDRFEWVAAGDAPARCLPELVAAQLRSALAGLA